MRYPRISHEQLKVGQKHTGFVQSISKFGAFVDFNGQDLGLLHISKIAQDLVLNIWDHLQVGQDVTVWISDIKDNRQVGLSMVESKIGHASQRWRMQHDGMTAWTQLHENEWHEGVVTEVKPFGVIVTVTQVDGQQADGLVHISQISDGRFLSEARARPEDEFIVGQDVKVRVMNVDENTGRLGLSLRAPSGLSAFEGMAEADVWLTATVTKLESFGAFLSAAVPDSGVQAIGLLHISRIGYHTIMRVADELQVGQEVKVRVVNVDPKAGTMNFAMTAQIARPSDYAAFEGMSSRQWLEGRVEAVTTLGAHVRVVVPGASAEGFVHISQIKDGYIQSAKDELRSGQFVQVRIKRVDTQAGHIDLSMLEPKGDEQG